MSRRIISDIPPTKRQLQVLRFIKRYIAKHGFSPSNLEISKNLRVSSPNSVPLKLDALCRRGLITKKFGGPRTVRLTPKGEEVAGDK